MNINRLSVLLVVFLLSFSACSEPPHSYTQARRISKSIFRVHPITLYCACKYDSSGHIQLKSCRMSSAKQRFRANRVEWEHIMPAQQFGHHYRCWRKAICRTHKGKRYRGRKCCSRINKHFRRVEGELYNLWPAVGLVNQARSNFRYAAETTIQKGYFGCNASVDKRNHQFVPPIRARGIVARANLFMAQKYHIPLSQAQRRMFFAWNQQYPPTEWELYWAKQVQEIEGYANPFITHHQKALEK